MVHGATFACVCEVKNAGVVFDDSWYHRDDDYNYYSGTVAELLEIATGKTNAENARGSFARKVGRALLLEMEIAGLIEEIEETED